MPLLTELKTLYYLTVRHPRGRDHATRIENFYAAQAAHYDRFRERMLHGRRQLYQSIPITPGGTWIDLGAGTGCCLEFIGDRIHTLGQVILVDISPSMLAIARQRIARAGWSNVKIIEADAATFVPTSGPADVITLSYALSMTPNWPATLTHARTLLKPHGHIGVVDFYTSLSHPPPTMVKHSWLTRAFWPTWFARGGVTISSELVPALHRDFAALSFAEQRGSLPYLPIARIPWFAFIGRRPSLPW